MKNERGYRLKPKHFKSLSRPMRVLLNVPVLRNCYTYDMPNFDFKNNHRQKTN